MALPQSQRFVFLMKQKLAPIPLDLYPTKEPYKPSVSELMAALEASIASFTFLEVRLAAPHPS